MIMMHLENLVSLDRWGLCSVFFAQKKLDVAHSLPNTIGFNTIELFLSYCLKYAKFILHLEQQYGREI